MTELRSAIGKGRSANEVRTRVEELDSLFNEAEAELSPESADPVSTFSMNTRQAATPRSVPRGVTVSTSGWR